MKLNWGSGIAIFYGFFAVSMIVFVFAARQHDPGLIAKNYYDLDLNYQQRMVEKQNAAALSEKLKVNFEAEKRQLVFDFPTETGLPTGGEIKLFRSAGTTAGDFLTAVRTDSAGRMVFPVEKLAAGRWRVEVVWQAGGRSFYQETAIFI